MQFPTGSYQTASATIRGTSTIERNNHSNLDVFFVVPYIVLMSPEKRQEGHGDATEGVRQVLIT